MIAGLPEKYGLSMDFFLLGQMLKAETIAIDERGDVLERARKVLEAIKSFWPIEDRSIILHQTDSIEDYGNEKLKGHPFDLALSSEVLQRLGSARGKYVANLIGKVKRFAFFVPNRGNSSHIKLSGLKSLYLKELLEYCLDGTSKVKIHEYGFIDMPPFPPGLYRTKNKREQAMENPLENFLMRGLEKYSLVEHIIPDFIKVKIAHIVYVIGGNGPLH